MLTQLLSPEQLAEAADLLLRGAVVALPTDTVYGVAADAASPEAIARLFEAKRRPLDKAIPLLVAEAQDLDLVAAFVPEPARRLAERFWPGALTIVVPRRALRSDDLPTVAVRMPDHPLARALIRLAGGTLAVTSANISGQPPATTVAEVMRQLDGRIAAVVEGGACPGGVASTIVDTTAGPPRVLRVGGVTIEALRRVVPRLLLGPGAAS
ncbi:MAG TPA: L-threonylcarbamoyladenylate synthase [Dehalococcoidia bacterium]|nr:L-threonylcarbamoyladenylate synthase [Dehalococcoidia bacterium]